MSSCFKVLATLIVIVMLAVLFKPEIAVAQGLKRFRMLAIDVTFDHTFMQSGQHMIETFLNYPNWHNTSQYQACIDLLTQYQYSDLNDSMKPFYRGESNKANAQYEIVNFLGQASPGEIVIFYYCGHGSNKDLADLGVNYTELISWLSSGGLPQACVVVILDTCHSGSWIDDGEGGGGVLGPDRCVLAACMASQLAWGGGLDVSGVFTHFINEGTSLASDVDNDGWVSAAELFDYAKPQTQNFVQGWTNQTPTSYYEIMGGDIPLVQRDPVKSFPERDVSVVSVNVSPNYVIAGTGVQIGYSVRNKGGKMGIFNINIRSNSSKIVNQSISLGPYETQSFLYAWDTTGLCNGTYLITVSARITPCESNISDNSLTDGSVYIRQKGLLIVPDQYLTIQDAVNNASSFDTIRVRSGLYTENVIIDKPLTLEGENSFSTIVDGNVTGIGIQVIACNVSISNFTIQNCAYGLLMLDSSEDIVADNIFTSNLYGLFLQQSGNNTFRNNTFTTNKYNIGVRGTEISYFINSMDSSNTVSGKPVYYLIDQHDGEVPSDAGFIALINSTGMKVTDANIQNSYDGILLVNSSYMIIEDCNFTANYYGLSFIFSSRITAAYNNIVNCSYGAAAVFSSSCFVFLNNFVNNTNPAYVYESQLSWCPEECGNFWSDYFGYDFNQDGIGDFSYPIPGAQSDSFPLMAPVQRFYAGTWSVTSFHVAAISNCAISSFSFNNNTMTISFNVTGPDDGTGFSRLNIPKDLLDCPEGIDGWKILCDGADISVQCNKWENASYTFIYIPCGSGLHSIRVIGTKAVPEFPSSVLITLLALLSLTIALVRKKRFHNVSCQLTWRHIQNELKTKTYIVYCYTILSTGEQQNERSTEKRRNSLASHKSHA
jgi:parallel beta-helix repeat protein